MASNPGPSMLSALGGGFSGPFMPRRPSVVQCRGGVLGLLEEPATYRRYHCRRCGMQVCICPQCDCGNVCCPGECQLWRIKHAYKTCSRPPGSPYKLMGFAMCAGFGLPLRRSPSDSPIRSGRSAVAAFLPQGRHPSACHGRLHAQRHGRKQAVYCRWHQTRRQRGLGEQGGRGRAPGCECWAKTAAVWIFVRPCHDPPAVFHLEVTLA